MWYSYNQYYALSTFWFALQQRIYVWNKLT
jgi:hypothetical protein